MNRWLITSFDFGLKSIAAKLAGNLRNVEYQQVFDLILRLDDREWTETPIP